YYRHCRAESRRAGRSTAPAWGRARPPVILCVGRRRGKALCGPAAAQHILAAKAPESNGVCRACAWRPAVNRYGSAGIYRPITGRQFMKLETLALHHGYTSEATTKAAAVPIYQTTSFTFDDTQHGADLFNLAVPGNIYTRIMNPTTDVLEKRVAEMEGGIGGLAVASGMSAITYAIQAIAGAGDNIVATSQLYGGTYNLF